MSTSNQPDITESSILASYLLTPSPLPTALPYSMFLNTCVPVTHRSHPHVKRLYRDLQFQRDIDVDAVRQNIERECARSGVLKGQLARQLQKENGRPEHGRKRKRENEKRRGDHENDMMKDEIDNEFDIIDSQIDTAMSNASAHPASKTQPSVQTSFGNAGHMPSSLIFSMETAITSLEREIGDFSSQNSRLLTGMTETVGQLSDLRYGRFARPSGANDQETVEKGMVEALEELKSAMRKVTND